MVAETSKMFAEELVENGAVSVEEAAVFTGLSRSKLYLLMQQGGLPFVKIGKARRVPRLALKRLLADGLRA